MLENIIERTKQKGRGVLVAGLAGLISLSSIFYGCEKENISMPIDPDKTIMLTFDDGPDAVYTSRILDILKEENVKATFFLVGNNMKKYPGVTNRIFKEGHLVGNHTTDHSHLVGQPFGKVYSNIMSTQKMIDSVYRLVDSSYDNSIKYFRPPWGLITQSQKDSLTKHGFKIILWDINSKDWSKTYDYNMIIDKVLSDVYYASKNEVILFHTNGYNYPDPPQDGLRGGKETAKALPRIIDVLKERGYVFKTVAEAN